MAIYEVYPRGHPLGLRMPGEFRSAEFEAEAMRMQDDLYRDVMRLYQPYPSEMGDARQLRAWRNGRKDWRLA